VQLIGHDAVVVDQEGEVGVTRSPGDGEGHES
jgi:hypothetical protein